MLGVAAVLAWAGGGWAAARLARPPAGRGPLRGLVAGVLALLLLLGLGYAFLRDAVDFYSAAVALGIVDPAAETGTMPAAVDAATTEVVRTSKPAEIARQRTLDSLGYAAVLALLLLGASVLGGVIGQGQPLRGVAPPRPLEPVAGSAG